MDETSFIATVQNIMARMPEGQRFANALAHGSMNVLLYAPRPADQQTPHDQDEVYFVIKGTGKFLNGAQWASFGEGDVIFVPAGVAHRFEDFTNDLTVWAVFYGPTGGEAT